MGRLGSGASFAGSAGTDAWENFPPAGLGQCTDIDYPLIIAVPVAQRPKAIARLESDAIVELTAPEVIAALDLPAGTTLSGVDLIKKEIERLRERRRAELENQQGSWGPGTARSSSYDNLRPRSIKPPTVLGSRCREERRDRRIWRIGMR
jgi:hypothetical protein